VTPALDNFAPATRAWFERTFGAPTPAQSLGWEAIASRSHTLIHAPTGSGKTLAAFLHAIDRLGRSPPGHGLRVVYVSPLKALAADVERNLRVPLAGIGSSLTVAVRSGDTPAAERRRLAKNPPDILVTTPESLYLLLTSAARAALVGVETVLVDEIHALAGQKRGAHLALSLERLERLAPGFQRIGLTATGHPLDAIARFLGGYEGETARPVAIASAPAPKPLDVRIELPPSDATTGLARELLALVTGHRQTIVFTGSRRLAERTASELNTLAGTELARAHHGSIALAQRAAIEAALKAGEIRAVVATSSLELGIDMGEVDLVVQVGAPASVASGLQRIGRSGHAIGRTSRGRIFPKNRADLLACAVVTAGMRAGAVEATVVPRNPLDVLSQQLVAMASFEEWTRDSLLTLVRRAAPFHELTDAAFDAVLDMLSGRYPEAAFADLRPRLIRDQGVVRGRPFAWRLAIANAGTIPDRGLFPVHPLGGGPRLGELDEEYVSELKGGEAFVLGASAWRVVTIARDRVYVEPAPGAAAKLPFWRGDAPSRPVELGRALGRLVRELEALDPDALARRLEGDLVPEAARLLASFLVEARAALGRLPSDRTIVLERMEDEVGEGLVCVLSPLGGRVHAPWALAIEAGLRARGIEPGRAFAADDGIVVRAPGLGERDARSVIFPEPEAASDLVLRSLAGSALFTSRFRECASRALLVPGRLPGKRSPLWIQRERARALLEAASRFPDFPIVHETVRECLEDVFDMNAFREVLAGVASGELAVVDVRPKTPSPLGASLASANALAFLTQANAPSAERRAQALALDRSLLREILGHDELRDLVSLEALAALEGELARLTPERRARGPEEVHDLLLALGDLSLEEIEERVAEPGAARAWLASLGERVRHVDGRWIAASDAEREPGDRIRRYARTHGPFAASAVARRFGFPEATVERELERLEAAGHLVRGGFRPGGTGTEWVDPDVLARLRRRSLQALRREVEPVEPEALGRFLPAWQGVGSARRGIAGLRETLRQLEGVPIQASLLESEVLPARVADYASFLLDDLVATGEIVWQGRGALGQADGKIALYRRERFSLLAPVTEAPVGPLAAAIRERLAARGASFFPELRATRSPSLEEDAALLDALWELVFAGEVVADAIAPLRAFLERRGARSRHARFAARIPAPGASRWQLARALATPVSPTAAAHAHVEALLDRHGVLTRDAVVAEGMPGGFSAIYPWLAALEDAGRVRRGSFVRGLGGAQFALPEAVDRLRSSARVGALVLAAGDPANPYGAALPWPDSITGRRAGSRVVLVEGALVLEHSRARRAITAFNKDEGALEQAVVALASGRGRSLEVVTVNGSPVLETPLAAVLRRAGFVSTSRGLIRERTSRAV
jgi:ATP-dependent Lhr-like helicase